MTANPSPEVVAMLIDEVESIAGKCCNVDRLIRQHLPLRYSFPRELFQDKNIAVPMPSPTSVLKDAKATLPDDIRCRIYKNPHGWSCITIRTSFGDDATTAHGWIGRGNTKCLSVLRASLRAYEALNRVSVCAAIALALTTQEQVS